MRIIAGQFKGQKLCAFSADFIRPMTDRVKTSLFDILTSHHYLTPQTQVLDLFSGTGNLAFEALSRGAKQVCLVEKSRKAIAIIKKNLEKLRPSHDQMPKTLTHADHLAFNLKDTFLNKKGLKACPCVTIHNKDVFRFLSHYKGQPFGLILADPPFKKMLAPKILSSLAVSSAVDSHTKLFLEISKQETLPLPEKSEGYNLIRQKNFGDKSLLFYQFIKQKEPAGKSIAPQNPLFF